MTNEIREKILAWAREGASSLSIFRKLKKEFPNEKIDKEEVKILISSAGFQKIDQLNITSVVEDDKKDFADLLEKLNKKTITIIEKKEILVYIITRLSKRIKSLEKMQIDNFSIQVENLIAKYHAELRAYVETLTKIEESTLPERQLIMNTIDLKLQILTQCFYRVIAEVTPDKLELIKGKLKDEIRKSIIAYNAEQQLLGREGGSND